MALQHSKSSGKPKRKSIWKGLGLGALGLVLACVGCCIAPLIGVFFTTSAGAGIAGMLSSRALLFGSLGGGFAILVYVAWKSRQISCCSSPGSACGNKGCGVPDSQVSSENARIC
jgi:hypothetical protein